ncbi:MAG: hypothetical protein PHI98_09710 [Eubacteriales bacterium]|nr:hypothetical protein [Eubacteriales bacterium]
MGDNRDEVRQRPESGLVFKKFTFFGSYDHSLDAKGRIIIPNAYRNALGDVFTVSITRDDKGIALYPDDVFDQLLEEIYRLNQRKQVVQQYLDHLSKMTYRGMEMDGQGRMLLPVKLRQQVLGDTKDVEISGALDHIRVIDSAVAKAEDEYFREHRTEILDEIGNMGDEK